MMADYIERRMREVGYGLPERLVQNEGGRNVNKVLKYNALFLGTAIFVFGVLKFFDPFTTWFHIQIAKIDLPPFFIPLGMAAEMSIGLSLLLATVFRERIGSLFRPVVALASTGLTVNMAVAIYVHLQPGVPASVLPLGIKPPLIPLFFLLLAGLNLFQLYRAKESAL
jgi:hypothetical protein